MIKTIDGSFYEQTYLLTPLVSKVLAFNQVDETKMDQILHPASSLQTSVASCVLEASQRIMQAKERHEKVFICGDYDADGICATTIMYDALLKLGIECYYYIPDRFKDGYGLSEEKCFSAIDFGCSLVITVDNGVKERDTILKIRAMGADVIVTDHHEMSEPVEANIVVHPDLLEERFTGLCGAGVALQIARNLIGNNDVQTVIACVATIGDVMTLWNENRTIVQLGIKLLNQGVCPPILKMMDYSTVIDKMSIAFNVVPKLNAIGRMKDDSNPNSLVRYLLCQDESIMNGFVAQINAVNAKRKELSSKMVRLAEKQVSDESFIILYDDSFEEGLSGLVAGKIANTYHRPTLVFAKSGSILKGSARSVPGFDLYTFFTEGFDELVSFGGHKAAAGLAIEEDQLDIFVKKVLDKMKNIEIEKVEDDSILIDLRSITEEAVEELRILEPFTVGLVEPLWTIQGFPVEEYRLLKDKYPKYKISSSLEAILFLTAGITISEHPRIITGTLQVNAFRGKKTCQIQIKNME